MSREFTFFQFDVDEETVRSLASSIPGVEPLPPGERDVDEDSAAPEDDRAPATDSDGDERSTGAPSSATDEAAVGSAGVEAHLDDSPSGGSAVGATKWTGPSTPWPGAPTDEEEDGGWRDRLTDKRTLLVGGTAVVLGVVGAVAVWYLKLRGADDDGSSGGGETTRNRGRTDAGPIDDVEADEPADEPHADDSESRSYPVDFAPVIGMAFLALGSLVLRHVQSRSED